jgi:hypothetical protein
MTRNVSEAFIAMLRGAKSANVHATFFLAFSWLALDVFAELQYF